MESLGDLLREAREEKGLTIEQAERETKILKCYLNAIEMEDFSDFPGETYVIGFIRNYADFLGCDADSCVQMYRNLVIQGQPVPLEALITTRKKINKKKLFGWLGAAAALLVTIVLLAFIPMWVAQKKASDSLKLQLRTAAVYEFNDSRGIFALDVKDSVSLTESVSQKDFIMRYAEYDPNEQTAWFDVTDALGAAAETFSVALHQSRLVDLNKDGVNDLKLSCKDLNRNGTLSLELDRAFTETPQLLLKDSLLTDEFFRRHSLEAADGVLFTSAQRLPIRIQLAAKEKNTLFYRADGAKLTQTEFQNDKKAFLLELRFGGIFWIANGNDLTVTVNDTPVQLPALTDPALVFLLSWKRLPATGEYELGYYLLDTE